jgi:hypothetical protein
MTKRSVHVLVAALVAGCGPRPPEATQTHASDGAAAATLFGDVIDRAIAALGHAISS